MLSSKNSSHLKITWHVIAGIAYLAIVIMALSVAASRFETLVIAILIQIYAAVLFNFSVLSAAEDLNNYAAFVRFRILATSQGVEGNEDGQFVDQEGALATAIKSGRVITTINRVSNAMVP